MKRIIKKAIVFLLLFGIWTDFQAQQLTIFTIGDSTMSDKENTDKNPERGWAQMLPEFLPQDIMVKNYAVNGRSTRSFIDQGRWDAVIKDVKVGDYVFIQFGHNDQKVNDPKRYTNPHTAYRNNLIKFVIESRNAGGTPILFTSIVRRKFNEFGTLIDTHGEYPLIVRLVANEFDVPLIDLQYLTEKLEESYGVAVSKKLHLHYGAGEHPYYPEGKQDDTHLSVFGANTIAKMVVDEMGKLKIFPFIPKNENRPSFKGVTGIRDTSYNTNYAYKKHVKKFPFIKIVEEFKIRNVKETKDLPYCLMNESALLLDVFEPKLDKNNIAIIIIHGGGWRSGNRSQHYPLAQKLASKGYVCFTPEYRLSTEALFPAAVYDIKAAIRWVRKNADQYGIDAEKIVVAGFSAGGELAAFMGTTANMPLFEGVNNMFSIQSHVNAVVDIDGTLSFVHPESGEGDDTNKTSAATNWFGYPKDGNYQLWEVASPLTFAGPTSAPTLFLNSPKSTMHAGRDDYIKILDHYKIYSEVHEFEDSPHDFCLFYPWFDDVVNKIDAFLLKVLQ